MTYVYFYLEYHFRVVFSRKERYEHLSKQRMHPGFAEMIEIALAAASYV